MLSSGYLAVARLLDSGAHCLKFQCSQESYGPAHEVERNLTRWTQSALRGTLVFSTHLRVAWRETAELPDKRNHSPYSHSIAIHNLHGGSVAPPEDVGKQVRYPTLRT